MKLHAKIASEICSFQLQQLFVIHFHARDRHPAPSPLASRKQVTAHPDKASRTCINEMPMPQEHMGLLESSREGKEALLIGLDYLLNISFVADDEVFKISLDYWNFFVPEVYSSVQTALVEMNGGFGGFGGQPNGGADNSRKRFFSQVLSRLRLLMITRMAKPEEVRSLMTHPTPPSLQGRCP